MLNFIYAECHYAECRYAESRYTECHFYYFADCTYAECCFAQCRGTINLAADFKDKPKQGTLLKRKAQYSWPPCTN